MLCTLCIINIYTQLNENFCKWIYSNIWCEHFAYIIYYLNTKFNLKCVTKRKHRYSCIKSFRYIFWREKKVSDFSCDSKQWCFYLWVWENLKRKAWNNQIEHNIVTHTNIGWIGNSIVNVINKASVEVNRSHIQRKCREIYLLDLDTYSLVWRCDCSSRLFWFNYVCNLYSPVGIQ